MNTFKVAWEKLFDRHLLLTNIFGGAGLAYLGDYTRQKTKSQPQQKGRVVDDERKVPGERRHSVDKQQSICMALVSLPLSVEMHFWYKMLDKVFPSNIKGGPIKKVICDVLVMAPNFTFTLIAGMSTLEGRGWSETVARLKISFWLLYLADVLFFAPVQFLNFSYFPAKYRTIVVYTAAIFYYYIASFFIHEYKAEEIKVQKSPDDY